MLDYKAIGRRIAYHRKRAYHTQASLERLNSIAQKINVDITILLSDSNPKIDTN